MRLVNWNTVYWVVRALAGMGAVTNAYPAHRSDAPDASSLIDLSLSDSPENFTTNDAGILMPKLAESNSADDAVELWMPDSFKLKKREAVGNSLIEPNNSTLSAEASSQEAARTIVRNVLNQLPEIPKRVGRENVPVSRQRFGVFNHAVAVRRDHEDLAQRERYALAKLIRRGDHGVPPCFLKIRIGWSGIRRQCCDVGIYSRKRASCRQSKLLIQETRKACLLDL